MKKLTSHLILIFLLCLSYVGFAQPANDICTGAIPLLPSPDGTGCLTPTFTLPFSTDGTTDSGTGTDCFGARFGLDQFFTWTATASALRWNDDSPGNPGIVIYENDGTTAAPSCGAQITCLSTFAATDAIVSGWTIGQDLIFQIYDFEGSVSDVAFCIEEACLPPDFSLSFDNSNCANDDYSIIVDLTSTGDAPLVDITNNTNGSSFVDQGAGVYTLTGFTGVDDIVTVTVGDTNFTNCLRSKSIVIPTGCPPSNDECTEAIAVTVGPEGDCSNQEVFNFPNATNSGEGVCTTSNGLNRPDVWFSFVVPATGHVKIIPGNVTGTTDLKIEVFEGTCASLNSILCDPTLIGASPIIANRTPGETLFVRIWEEGTTTNDYFICVHEINTIDVNDECADAIMLPVSPVGVCNAQTVTVGNSSYSGEGSCTIGLGDIANDTWYSFIVPASGFIKVQSSLNSNQFMDMHAEIFTGSCDTLVSVVCGGDGNNDLNFGVFDLPAGDTAYMRIWEDFNDQTGTVDICISEELPNQHNDCATAKLLTVNTACNFVQMDNISATPSFEGICTKEGGDDSPDVWASCIAPASGAITIETEDGSLFDMSLEVLTGSCDNLQSIACDDDTGPGGMNLVHVSNLTPGDTVYIRIWESFGNQVGNFSICVKEIPTPVSVDNNDCSTATVLTLPDGLCAGQTLISTLGASESVEANLCTNGYGGPQRDIWFQVSAPSDGGFLIEIEDIFGAPLFVEDVVLDVLTGSCGNLTSIDCVAGNFGITRRVSGLTPGEDVFIRIWADGSEGELNLCLSTAPPNDACVDAIDLSFDSLCINPTLGFTNAATASPEGTCNTSTPGEDVWFRFEGSLAAGKNIVFLAERVSNGFSPVLQVFESTTGSCTDMTSIDCVTGSSLATSFLNNADANKTYFLRVYETFNSNPGTFSICASEQPVNDLCSGAIPLDVGKGACTSPFLATNVGMSDSPEGTCTIDDGTDALDAWFKTTIPASGNLVIETNSGPSNGFFDTVMEVLLGSDCSNLTSFDCDDNDGPSSFSRVELLGQNPGDQVFIRVWESFNNAFNDFTICAFEPVINDECSDAIELSISASKADCNYQSFSAEGASASFQFSACGDQFDDDVWLFFEATSENVIIDIPEQNAVVELYNLPNCNNLGGQILACHQRFPMLADNLTIGQDYFLRVASAGPAPNVLEEFSVCIYEADVPANDECAGAIPLPMGCDTTICGTTALATFSNDGSCSNLNGDNNATDVWFSVTAPASGALLFNMTSENFDAMAIEIYAGNSCGDKTSLSCIDFEGGTDEFFISDITPGSTVFLRLWDVNIGFAATGVFFNLCVTDPEPENNNCLDAIMIATQPAPCFTPTEGTNLGSNFENIGSCALGGGDVAAKDVWYQTIVPPSGKVIIRTSEALENSITNTVLEVFTGPDCGNLTSIACEDDGAIGEFASVEISSEPAGTLLWIRVWEFDSDEFRNFNICAIEPPTSSDECSNAAEIAVNPDFCVDPVIASFEGASHSGLGTCTQGFGGSRDDIWFRLTAPASGNVNITTMRAGGLIFNNTAMEAFTGTCGNLTSIDCNDNTSTSNYAELMLTGLTPGETVFIRIWNATFFPIGEGFFYLCAVEPSTGPPANDECDNADILIVQPGDCVDFNGGTDFNATSSTPLAGAPADCQNNFNEKDIWFKVQIPANFETNDYFFQFQFANGSSVEFELYHGTCDALEFIDCVSVPTSITPFEFNIETFFLFNPGDILQELANIGLEPGDDLFFRVWSIASGPAIGGFCMRSTNDCIYAIDGDDDGVCDDVDNCLDLNNPGQSDTDNDGVGNDCDNCPDVANADQVDLNNNGIGDACENNCIENETYTQNPIPDTTRVSNDIIAGGNVIIQNNQQVLFDAGNTVLLNPFFEVKLGSVLVIKTDGCTQ